MSRLKSLFKTPKHQRFDYIPRYWDPDKEELKNRIETIRKAKEGDADALKERISGGLRRRGYLADRQYRSRQVRRSNMILLLVIIGLIMLSMIFIKVYLPTIESYFQ